MPAPTFGEEPRTTLISQQEAFDNFQNIFNFERPHEGIKNKYPSEIYKRSDKEFKKLEPLFYPMHDQTITVTTCGRICTKKLKVSLSRSFAGQQVGIKEMEDGIWVVSFMDYDLGYFDEKGNVIKEHLVPKTKKVFTYSYDEKNNMIEKRKNEILHLLSLNLYLILSPILENAGL